jgi:hypothetical protein
MKEDAASIFTLKMNATWSSDTVGSYHIATWRHNREDHFIIIIIRSRINQEFHLEVAVNLIYVPVLFLFSHCS